MEFSQPASGTNYNSFSQTLSPSSTRVAAPEKVGRQFSHLFKEKKICTFSEIDHTEVYEKAKATEKFYGSLSILTELIAGIGFAITSIELFAEYGNGSEEKTILNLIFSINKVSLLFFSSLGLAAISYLYSEKSTHHKALAEKFAGPSLLNFKLL